MNNDAVSRREFVGKGVGLIGLGLTVPYFLSKTAWALGDAQTETGNTDGRILVVLQLAGGNDGLNTVIPIRDDLYYKARPQIAIQADKALKVHDNFAFHPSATGLKKLYEDGVLGVVLGVGYPNPNRSHFVGTDIWSSADPEQRTFTGWIGRYLDHYSQKTKQTDPELGIATTEETPFAMQGEKFCPICFESPDQLQWRTKPSNRGAEEVLEKLHESKGKPSTGKTLTALDFVRKATQDARSSAEEIRKAAQSGNRGGGFGRFGAFLGRGKNSLEQQLNMVVKMIAAGLPTKVYYVSLGGFDTHSGQIGRHQNLMKELGDALSSFTNALKESHLEDRVLLMSFSEFGRRVSQNASGGTDHGTAAPLFIVGAGVKAGFHGQYPKLDNLDNGDLKFTTDFRSVYAGVIQDWLQTNPETILGKQFSPLRCVKKA